MSLKPGMVLKASATVLFLFFLTGCADKVPPPTRQITLATQAIAQAESGFKEDAWHANSNGTLDTGIFQVNSIHWGKEGCSFKELTDAYKNVDCAKRIFDESGWASWVSYNSGVYLAHLDAN